MSERKVRIGIIGANDISYVHEAGYAEIDDLCELVAFYDFNVENARKRASRYHARVYLNYEDLLADPQIDMVDLATPLSVRHPLALAALSAGKHVLVEKPMAATAVQAWQLIETAQQMDVQFTVAENIFFVAAYREARRLLRENILGEIRLARISTTTNALNYTQSELDLENGRQTLLLNPGVSTFALLEWLLGEVQDIQAFTYKLLPESDTEDHILTIGHLTGGAMFTALLCSIREGRWTERLEIHGSLGSLIVDQLANPPQIYFHDDGEMNIPPALEMSQEPQAWQYLSIVAEVQDFVRAILDKRSPSIGPSAGCRALQIIEAVQKSMLKGCGVTLTADTVPTI